MGVRLNIADVENLILSKPVETPDGFLTRAQWCGHLGIPESRLNSILTDLHQKGYVEMTKIPTRNIMGGISMTPVYKINIPSAAKKTRAKARPKTAV